VSRPTTDIPTSDVDMISRPARVMPLILSTKCSA
jgi:hypothetical protein